MLKNNKLYTQLQSLTNTTYFRIVRINMKAQCPFWTANHVCFSDKCQLQEITDIPPEFKENKETDEDVEFSVKTTYKWSFEREKNNNEWEWHIEELENDEGVYIDLIANPEGFTGYRGQKIWEAIHRENCFQGTWNNMCREERALNKIISGFHTSISAQFQPNLLQFPDRIRNLFFLYAFVLKSFTLASDSIAKANIRSNDSYSDAYSRQLLAQVLDIAQSECHSVFDERSYYQKLEPKILKGYQQFIQNISQIMNCVECEKCKLHAKVSTYGIGTAMKILFQNFPKTFQGNLKRNELITFVNTFAKLSHSVKIVHEQYEARLQLYQYGIIALAFGGGIAMFAIYYLIKGPKKNKVKKQ